MSENLSGVADFYIHQKLNRFGRLLSSMYKKGLKVTNSDAETSTEVSPQLPAQKAVKLPCSGGSLDETPS